MNSRILWNAYRILTIFAVPRFVRERHDRENRIRLEEATWDFWDRPGVYIENQAEWGQIRFGVGKRCSMAYAGCEIIATYNVKKALGGAVSRRDMAELICAYEARGAALWGMFGVAPTAIAAYFRKNGFRTETADGQEKEAVELIGREFPVMIATACNDKNDITAQIHTVCITRNQGGKYVLHNSYCRDEKGRYVESAPYETLQEAVGHISRREPKLIYLIGIAGK